jgi:hypothetical protein
MLLETLTTILGVFLIFIVLRAVKHLAVTNNNYSKLPSQVAIFLAIWLIYLSVISYTEVLNDFSLPPKLPLLVVMPIFVVLIISLLKKATADFVSVTAVSWLIYIQGFRIIVELIIWGAYQIQLMPLVTTFEGNNYDVLVGISAIPMAYYAKSITASRKLLILWNIAGLLVLANTVRVIITSVYFPEAIGLSSGAFGADFVSLPYLLIPGLFMPLAVYIHALSIKQLLRQTK